MNPQAILNIPAVNTIIAESLSRELSISRILAQVLVNRGITTVNEADRFLHANIEHLHNPFDFTSMKEAVSLIRRTIDKKQRILVHGDYDVDGITSVALLENVLKAMGADVEHYIPHRLKEGYGLHKTIPRRAHEKKYRCSSQPTAAQIAKTKSLN